ncbi:MAG: hypothetical protein E7595_02160 [Ruminococcaceae bacterium]|nr:hypothetical protein [Oscillospiraceae bacterium]
MKKEKKQKEKITYIDDGRTIADMSALPERHPWTKRGTTSSFREIWRTYWSATRMMLKPTLVAVGFLLAAFLIVSLIFWLL